MATKLKASKKTPKGESKTAAPKKKGESKSKWDDLGTVVEAWTQKLKSSEKEWVEELGDGPKRLAVARKLRKQK